MNKFTTNDARIVESKANDPTQADMQLVRELDKLIKDFGRYLPEYRLHHAKASQMIHKHVQEEVQQAVRAETQRMCDVAYAVYNHGDPEVPTLWMDGAAAVFEALGKEVK